MSPSAGNSAPWIVALGSINADHQMRVAEPPCGGSILATDLQRLPGGKAGNVAIGASRLGCHVVLIGSVGDDDLAEVALSGPRLAGLDLSGVRSVRGQTGLSTILVEPDGAKSIVLALNANDEPDDRDAAGEALRTAPDGSVLVVDLEIHRTTALAALRAARDHGRVTVLDPAPADRVDHELLRLADHIVPDHHEAAELIGGDVDGTERALAAARELRRRGAGTAHVKLPEGGCATSSRDGDWLTLPPDDLDVVDTTGAGDAFAFGLAVAVTEARPPLEQTRWAVAAAACAVGAEGSQAAYPGREVQERMSRAVRIVESP